MSKILIITTEFISFAGSATGGRGVRLENLATGLKEHGHTVYFSFLEENYQKLKIKPPSELTKYLHNYFYDDIIETLKPDVILFSPWTLAINLRNEKILEEYCIGIDLPGPLAIENSFEKNEEDIIFAAKKIMALNKADFFLCSTDRQKYYLLSWLLLSGHSLEKDPIIICPISCNLYDNSKKIYPKIPEYIFSGVLWPWQNYGENLEVIAEYLENKNGLLKTFCSPFIYSNKQNQKNNLSALDKYKSVKQFGLIEHSVLLEHYQTASAAIELYLPNVERSLAMTTRTLEYLANALPVIYSKDMFFSEIIKDYDAGWVIDPNNKSELIETLEEINNNPQVCAVKGKNAQKIILEKFNNKIATQNLARYCEKPFKTNKTKNYFVYSMSAIFNNSETIWQLKNLLNSKENELLAKSNELENTKSRLNNTNVELNNTLEKLNNALEKIKSLENENNFLTNDLNRIKSRLVFRILLKLKKIFDAVFGKF